MSFIYDNVRCIYLVVPRVLHIKVQKAVKSWDSYEVGDSFHPHFGPLISLT